MLEKIYEILAEASECSTVNMAEESNLIGDLSLSSLDIINTVVMFEDEFNIEIPDEDIKDLTTIGDIKKYIEAKI